MVGPVPARVLGLGRARVRVGVGVVGAALHGGSDVLERVAVATARHATCGSVVLRVVVLGGRGWRVGVRERRQPRRLRVPWVRWLGRVLDCTVVLSATGSRTELRLDATGPGAIGATVALDEADAAAEAAKAEADRWGSAVPEPEQTERFW